MAGTTRRGARPARSHHGQGPHGGTGDDGWPVLMAGLGRWHKLERASGHASGKVTGGGAHPSGMTVARGWSSGGQLRTSTPNVEVVADGDPSEVLWLGGGYAAVWAEPLQKR
jgi:hypothetical protein